MQTEHKDGGGAEAEFSANPSKDALPAAGVVTMGFSRLLSRTRFKPSWKLSSNSWTSALPRDTEQQAPSDGADAGCCGAGLGSCGRMFDVVGVVGSTSMGTWEDAERVVRVTAGARGI